VSEASNLNQLLWVLRAVLKKQYHLQKITHIFQCSDYFFFFYF